MTPAVPQLGHVQRMLQLAEQAGELRAFGVGQRGEHGRLDGEVGGDVVDERQPRFGQFDVDDARVLRMAVTTDEAGLLELVHALRDAAGADEVRVGEFSRGAAVGRAQPSEGGEHAERGHRCRAPRQVRGGVVSG